MATTFEAAMIEQSKSGPVIESVVHVVMALMLVILWPVGMALVVVVIRGPVGMALVVLVIRGLVGMVVVVVVIRRPEGMSVGKLEPLVMGGPEVLALVKMEQLVMHLVQKMEPEVVNALVLPKLLD